ncbi:MAG: CIA30 family protein [Leeuwenhoekiella sp.]
MRIVLIITILISLMSNTNKKTDSPAIENQSAKSESNQEVLYSFSKQGKGKWRVQNDVVMGGRSKSTLKITDNNAHFSGQVSLENDGGFCSIHQTVENDPYIISDKSKAFLLHLKGDGKDYNFRVRTPKGRHSYAFTFPTKGNDTWETISIPFDKMEATYHGEPVEVANYAGENVMEMQLLIGNQKEQTFEIYIESIGVN